MTKTERKVSREKQRLERYINDLHRCAVDYEYQFHPERKWRFDWAILTGKDPNRRIAIEYEGAVFTNGGHVRGSGYTANCEKYNTAALMGWTVLRFTAPMIRAGMHETMIAKALE
jgi:hypothetical protein